MVFLACAAASGGIVTDRDIVYNFGSDDHVIFVDADAKGANNGSTWDNAFTDLQDALAIATAGKDIWVAEGTYKPGTSRTDSFQMKNGVGIYGSFNGSETKIDQRDIQANPTILSGEIGIADDEKDNCYHVFYHPSDASVDETAILDGFTITAGCADGAYPHYYGGGIYNSFSSSPTLTNCTFIGNKAMSHGGGMCNFHYSNSTFTNCTFIDNTAGNGAGMYICNSTPTLTNCTFNGNTAKYKGGGIYNYSSSPTIANCTFSANTSSLNSGGGMHNSSSSPMLTNCIIWGDIAGSEGDQIYNDNDSTPAISYCCIQDGYAGTGNISADPLFADMDGLDGIAGTLDDDLRLSAGSPCIDAGNNQIILDPDNDGITTISLLSDISGKIRYVDDLSTADTGLSFLISWPVIDMGAYEYPSTTPIEGDIDGDGDVDMADLARLAANWMVRVE